MKKIGSSFYDELAAYGGLVGEHFTWHSDGNIEFFDDTPPTVVDAVKLIYVDHDPAHHSLFEISERIATLMAAADRATEGMGDAYTAGLLSKQDITRLKAWASYRVSLNGIPKQAGYPRDIDWPTPPEQERPDADH